MRERLPRHDVVLLGVGHTNAHILRMWKMQPYPDARLTCISNYSVATYSGMLPGVLAGQYRTEDMEIDLVRLCASANSRLIVDEVDGIDFDDRRVAFANRPSIPFDALSIGVGSVPNQDILRQDLDREANPQVVLIKPMQTFLARLELAVKNFVRETEAGEFRVTIVGGGAGGVEIALCLQQGVESWLDGRELKIRLISSHSVLGKGVSVAAERSVRAEFSNRNIEHVMDRVVSVEEGDVVLESGATLQADLILWATSAEAPPLLARIDLPKDERGFLLTRDTLQTTADHPVFAVGDTGTLASHRTPKAGVYAVRQGPILWENLQRILNNKPLLEYKPQSNFLKLLNLGNGRAVADYYGFSWSGKSSWRLKNYIDVKFMRMYQDYTPSMMTMPADEDALADQMRCAGCGGKVGGSVLHNALARIDVPTNDQIEIGLDQPDDVAIFSTRGNSIAATVDFFTSFIDDPYIVGRVAALNALSDLFASGARPVAALAVATIPLGRPRHQENLLYQLLAGGIEEFRKVGAALVGGHTIEGPQTTIGYALMGEPDGAPWTKGNCQQGDNLILTKPLGSGILLAAHMQALCKASWLDALLPLLLASNWEPAQIARKFDVQAVTDVTGFGLAGHLLEMLRASGHSATLQLDSIPLYDGATELIGQGIESTLAAANGDVKTWIDVEPNLEKVAEQAAFKVLFDPQTSGGLLLAMSPAKTDDALAELRTVSADAAVIGQIGNRENEVRLRIQ
jgi:selenide,water dikinase